MQKILLSLCCIVLLLLLFVGFFHPIKSINEDLGRHLLLGEIITQTGNVPTSNLLSYTYQDYPFINSHWLSEVIFYKFVNVGGFNSLLFFTTILTLSSFFLLFRLASKQYSMTYSLLAGVVLLPIILRRSEVRPEVFSFFFEAIFLTILFTYRSKYTKWIYLLIPLQILWVNMHIYFVIGIVLIIIFLFDLLVRQKFHFNYQAKVLTVVFLCSMLSTLLNPSGIYGTLFPFVVLQNYGMPVLENQSIFLITNQNHMLQLAYTVLIMIVVFMVLFLNRKKTLLIDWLLVISFSILAFAAVRNIPVYAYAVYVPLTALFSRYIPLVGKTLSTIYSKTFIKSLHVFSLSMLLIILLFYLFSIVATRPFGFGIIENAKTSADFFLINNLQGPIFNNFNTGSYYAYRFYPKEKIFVDGRPEAYPKAFFTDIYLPMRNNPQIFAKQMNVYDFNTIIISDWKYGGVEKNVIEMLRNEKRYALVYLDEHELIFVKRITEHKEVISRYTIDNESLRMKLEEF